MLVEIQHQEVKYVVEDASIGTYFIRRKGFGTGILYTVNFDGSLNRCSVHHLKPCLHGDILEAAAEKSPDELSLRGTEDIEHSNGDFRFAGKTYRVVEPMICTFFIAEKGSGEGYLVDMCEDLRIWNCSQDGIGVTVDKPCWHGLLTLDYIKFIDAKLQEDK